jgi:hypothetical protein
MIAEAGFLFAVAAVSMSLASLAGLVVAFRRSGAWALYDLYRLRQIVEFGFANVLLALALIPLVGIVGSVEGAVRVVAAIALAYFIGHMFVMLRRWRAIEPSEGVPTVVVALDFLVIVLMTTTIVLGAVTAWESVLILLIARPMIAFLLVLATLRGDG